jgi:hypothetical protein
MRVTLQDNRQMVGQMLAFDKVCPFCASPDTPPSTNNTAAHEPRPRRHGGVPPHTTKDQGCARRIPAGHRDRGATRHWTDHHPRCPRHLAVCRRPAARRPCRATGRSLWRSLDCCDTGSGTRRYTTNSTWRSSSWPDWTRDWRRRTRPWFRCASVRWRTTRLWRTTSWLRWTWRTPRRTA